MAESAAVVRQCYDLLNRGDVDGLTELCSDDFRIDMTERVFNPDCYLGHDGIRRFYAGVTEAWESYQWDVEETHDGPGDAVVAMLHCYGRSRVGGPDVDWRVAWVWEVKDGTPVSLRFFRDRSKALEAAGLSK